MRLDILFPNFCNWDAGLRKLRVGQTVSRDENFTENGKHLSALGSNIGLY